MVVYLYKKGRQTMKNIITTIAIVLFISSSVQLNAQYRKYRNVGIYLEQLLDSNDIFYVGVRDRALLSQNKESYVHKEYSDLVKFDSIYQNNEFMTVPDTNRVIMKSVELFKNRIWVDESTYFVVNMLMSNDNGDIVGIKTFETPKSKRYVRIILYEKVVRGNGRPDFFTWGIGEHLDGTYSLLDSN
jgi:hypothetical protein